jgi:hypothetical protein
LVSAGVVRESLLLSPDVGDPLQDRDHLGLLQVGTRVTCFGPAGRPLDLNRPDLELAVSLRCEYSCFPSDDHAGWMWRPACS